MSISPQAVEVLKAQKAKTNDQYVFPRPNGGPISPDSVNNMLKRVLERAGIPKVRFHDLRHSCTSLLYDNDVNLKEIQEWLDHSDIFTTLNIFNHLNFDFPAEIRFGLFFHKTACNLRCSFTAGAGKVR